MGGIKVNKVASVSGFPSYIFTVQRFVNVTVYTMQQYHFTLTISARMSQELWNIEIICTDELLQVSMHHFLVTSMIKCLQDKI